MCVAMGSQFPHPPLVPQAQAGRGRDFADARDEASDRLRSLQELQQQGYEEAYHQFIEPIVGASGELLFPATP